MKKERDYLFDNIKLLLIFLVVFAHLAEPYVNGSLWLKRIYLMIYTFHMPLFIFISGYFSKHDEDKKGKLICYYFLPYVILNTLFSYLQTQELGINITSPNWAFWYFLSLCWWKLLSPYMKELRHPIFVSLVVACLIGFIPSFQRQLSLSRTVVFFPFFLAGYFCPPSLVTKLRKKHLGYAMLGLMACVFMSIWFIDQGYFNSRVLYQAEAYPEGAEMSYLCFRALSLLIASGLIISIIRIVPKRKFWFSRFGQYTMPVFIAHIYILFFIIRPLGLLTNQTIEVIGLCIVLTLLHMLIFGNSFFQKLYQSIGTVFEGMLIRKKDDEV